MWTYKQKTGELYAPDGELIGIGYAGNGGGKNNPAMQGVSLIGPLPRGLYTIGPAYKHIRLGPITMNLEPDRDNQMFDRSLFRIHGDNTKHDASEGCIVQSNSVRLAISLSRDRQLQVIEG